MGPKPISVGILLNVTADGVTGRIVNLRRILNQREYCQCPFTVIPHTGVILFILHLNSTENKITDNVSLLNCCIFDEVQKKKNKWKTFQLVQLFDWTWYLKKKNMRFSKYTRSYNVCLLILKTRILVSESCGKYTKLYKSG